jgi:hypothetical protein
MEIHPDIKEAVQLINGSGLSAKEKEEAIADLVTAHAAEKAKVKQPAASVQEAKRILATQLEQLKKDHVDIKPEEPYSVKDYELPKEVFFFGNDGKSTSRFFAATDGLGISICFDYELARECKEVVKLVKNWPQAEQRVGRLLKLPYLARWAGGQYHQEPSKPVIETASAEDVILQLVSEGVGSVAQIAAEMNVSVGIIEEQISSLMQAGRLEKDGPCYRLSSTEAAKPLQGTELQAEDNLQAPNLVEAPLVPTICLAARKWFPQPWFSIPLDERSRLVKLFGPAYDGFRPLIISEGHEPIDQTKMRDMGMSADNERSHHLKRYTMLVDWSEPATRIQKRFENWLAKNKPQDVKTRSRRGHHKPAELLWALSFYRLSKYPVAERDEKGCELLKCSKRRSMSSGEPKHCGTISGSRISRGKRRIQEEMKRLRYV